MNLQQFSKPEIELGFRTDEKHLWERFHPYHYMTANQDAKDSFPRGAKMYTVYWIKEQEEILVACIGVLFQIAKVPAKRITRAVVLPEYQGLGFGSRIINAISEYYTNHGFRIYLSTYHPRLGEYMTHSRKWSAGMYNQQEFKQTDIHVEKSMSGLRDGQKMYRFVYTGDKPELNYDPIVLDELRRKEKDFVLTDDNEGEYKEIIRELKKNEVKFDEKFLMGIISDEDNKRYDYGNRNKRKPLTKEERKAAKSAKAAKAAKAAKLQK